MDLFESSGNKSLQPLAFRMRPRTLDEYAGQNHIVGKGKLLRRMIQADQLSSLIFYGPPGTGKTTLAEVIARATKSVFVTMNAVLSGVKVLREEIDKAKERYSLYQRKTILFIDEIHRWNKAQQDALLPWVENGTIILIGATTENPYFEVNSALVSRSRIFQLKPLSKGDLYRIAEEALKDTERGYGRYEVEIAPDALEHLVKIASGDARTLLNAVELAVETTPTVFPPPDGEKIKISLETAEESIQRKVVLYDKEGDYHFDVISAFIKSIRGSDPDAVLYWLAKMIRAGEDPKFIFRRMLISACEDIGLADPGALTVIEAAAAAFDRVGLPEGRFHLTHAALYLATAPKSNSSLGFFEALKAVEAEESGEVPNHLKDSGRDKEGFGHGKGYLYPHAYKDHWTAQQYLPDTHRGEVFYAPSKSGYEKKIRDDVFRKREANMEAAAPVFPEVLVTSPSGKGRDKWLKRLQSDSSSVLMQIRDDLFSKADISAHHNILVLNTGKGLFLWEACRKASGGIIYAAPGDGKFSPQDYRMLSGYAGQLDKMERPVIIDTDFDRFTFPKDLCFERIIGRNVFTRKGDERISFLKRILSLLCGGGTAIFSESIPSKASRLSEISETAKIPPEYISILKEAEKLLYQPGGNPVTGWNEKDLQKAFAEAEFHDIGVNVKTYRQMRIIRSEDIANWFNSSSQQYGYGKSLSLCTDPETAERIIASLQKALDGKEITWKSAVCTISGRKNIK